MGKRILILLGIILAASSHSSVEATESSRRLPTERIRGQRRVKEESKPDDKKTRNRPQVFRPTPKTFDKVGLNLKTGKPDNTAELKLPEPQVEDEQAMTIRVGKKSDSDQTVGGGLSSLLKGNDGIGIGKNNKKAEQNGLEHFKEVEVEIYRREIPSFSIKFHVEDSTSSNLPNLANYNELSQVSEEYLHQSFQSLVEDVQVRHDGTVLFLEASEDDFFNVNFLLTLEFIIPGEVPSINFLIDGLQGALETSQSSFIEDLNVMSETNPFSKTVSFEITSRPAVASVELGPGGGRPQLGGVDKLGKNNVLIPVIAAMGCVVLIGAGLMWRKKKIKKGAVSDSNEAFSLFDKSNKSATSSDSNSSGIYGADEDTMSYLNSIRKRYRDNGDKKSPSVASNDNNIAPVDQSGSYEDSMCETVDTGYGNEKKECKAVEEC